MTTKEGGLRGSIRNVGVGVSAIPDSEENRWPIKEDTFPLENIVGAADLTEVGSPSLIDDANAIEGKMLDCSGQGGAEASASSNAGAMSWAVTIDFSSDITDIQRIYGWGVPTANGDRVIRFRGDQETNRLVVGVTDDSNNFSTINTVVSQGRHRVAGVIDPSNDEFKLGLDGSFAATGTVSGNFQSTLSDVVVGTLSGGTRQFIGSVDEPRHDGRAWNTQILSDDYNRQPWS